MNRRRWGIGLGLVVALAIAGLLAAWQAQGWLLRQALERAVVASAGRLSVDDARGTLLEGARIARLRWTDPQGLQIDLQDLQLRWQWIDLLRGHLVLSELRAVELRVRLAPAGEPFTLPESIALPLPVALRDLRLTRLILEPAQGSALTLRDIALRADYEAGRFRLERLAVSGDWGELSAQASIADRAPFRLAASATVRTGWQSAVLGVGLSGPLADLQWAARVHAGPARLSANGRLQMLAGRVLGPVALSARGLTPALLGLAGVQRGLIDGEGELDWRSDAPGEPISVRLDLRNRDPAPLDQGGLPVARARGLVRWQGQQWRIEPLQLDIAPMAGGSAAPAAPTLTGSVRIDAARRLVLPWLTLPGLQVDLRLAGLESPALDSRLPPGRLSGRLRLDESRIEADLVDAVHGGAALRVSASLAGDRLDLTQLQASSLPGLAGAQLQASGSAQLVAPWVLDLKGGFSGVDIARLQALQPALVARPLQGRIDGHWSLAGPLGDATHPRALEARLEIDQGVLQGQPLRARASGRLEPGRLAGLAVSVELGPNRLRVEGAAGQEQDRLDYRLEAPAIGSLAVLAGLPGWQGDLTARGSWQGTPAHPRLSIEAQTRALRTEGLALGRSSLTARLDERHLSLRAQLLDLVVRGQRFEQFTAQADGTPAAHVARLDLRRGAQQVSAVLEGELAGSAWQGLLRELQTRGPVAASLREPAQLAFSAHGARLGAALIEGDMGRVRIARAQWQDGRWAVAGEAGLSRLASLAAALGFERPTLPPGVDADAVRVDLKADLAGTTALDASGSLSLKAIPPPGFDAAVNADLVLREGALSGDVDLALPTLSVANRWIGPEWSVDGRIRLVGRVSGTMVAPRLAGDVVGESLRLTQRSLGWRLGAGTLSARFEGDRLVLRSLRLFSGQAAIDAAPGAGAAAPGAIDLTGELSLIERTGRFRLTARAVAIPLGPGQRLVMSGQADAVSRAGRVELKGQLRADEGLIELRGGDAPALPADVEIVDRTAAAPAAPSGAPGRPARAEESSLRLVSDMTIDLGEKLRVRGSGVDVRLTGALSLRGTLPEAPRAFGTVRIRDGTYAAYGQQLQIERGRVVFNGPIDNPLLDLAAYRRTVPVEGGVSVSGTALAPRIRLISRPDVPDAEKLSWLVLGVPLDNAQSGAQVVALQAAAATLFGNNDGGLARTLGLDVLTVRSSLGADSFTSAPGMSGFAAAGPVPGQVGSGTVTATSATAGQSVVAIGKRLNARLLLTYEQGLTGVWNLLRIQYDITNRLSLRAQTGSESAFDVLYRLSFD
ncbi:MAG: translocation/assembly module TamB domain-containing protein [Burkholderiales bacterium]|nr:translocation/assembly module TamB domain-containing protein [Burkholderiales bacterium]